jgi:thiol-disulfide isomerase/thioredoxin
MRRFARSLVLCSANLLWAGLAGSQQRPAEAEPAALREVLAHRKLTPGVDPWATVLPECRALQAELEGRIAAEADPDTRAALEIGLMRIWLDALMPPPPEVTLRVIANVAPLSRHWAANPRAIHVLESPAAGEQGHTYLRAMAQGHPDKTIQVLSLSALYGDAKANGRLPEAKALLEELGRRFPGSPEYRKAKALEEQLGRTDPGLKAPAFALPTLREPGSLSLASLRGKYVLVDFWATWCSVCRVEMPILEKAWARFQNRDLVMVSVACDAKRETTEAFLAKGGPIMPWRQVWLAGGMASPLGKAYGLTSLPKLVLVGPDGTILAAERSLRGDNLAATLDRILPKQGGAAGRP